MFESVRLSRRSLLATVGAGTLAATVPGRAVAAGPEESPPTPSDTREVDVAIVGAGLTGRTAARQLRRAGRNVQFFNGGLGGTSARRCTPMGSPSGPAASSSPSRRR